MKTFKKVIALVLSVLMLVSAMPFTALTAMAADEVSIDFNTPVESSSNNDYQPWDGGKYDIWNGNFSGNTGTYSVGGGIAELNGGCIFINAGDAKTNIKSNSFTFSFRAKYTGNETCTLAAIASGSEDYIRIDTDNKFVVNNQYYDVELPLSNFADYAISYNGSSVKLYINGVEVKSVDARISVNTSGAYYPSLGWSDKCGHSMIKDAQYRSAKVTGTTFDAAAYLTEKKNAATAATSKKTGNAVGNFAGKTTNGYYKNLVYCSTEVAWNGNGAATGDAASNESNSLTSKIANPKNVVMLYDGNDAYYPIKVEAISSDKKRVVTIIPYDVDSKKSAVTFKQNWLESAKAWNEWDDDGYTTNFQAAYSANSFYWEYNTYIKGNKFFINKAYYDPNGAIKLDDNTTYGTVNYINVNVYTGNLESEMKGYTYNNQVSINVVNYKPIADMFEDVKNTVLDVDGKADGYYVNADEFYVLASNVLNLDPNTFEYSSDAAKATKACGEEIKSAVAAYNAFELEKHECVAGEAQEENVVAPTASKDGSYNLVKRCTICNEIVSTESKTKDKTGNFEAYDAVIDEVSALDRTKYTAESLTALDTAVSNGANIKTAADTQDDIDAVVTEIRTAISNLKLNAYTVNVYTFENDKAELATTATVKAGDVYAATVEGKTISKWTVSGTSADKKIGTNQSTVYAVINEDTNIYAHIESNTTPAEDNIKVTYLGYLGKVVAVDYTNVVPTEETNKDNAEKIPFYTFNKWTVVKTGDYEYKMVANYSVSGGYCYVMVDGGVNGSGSYGYDESVNFEKNPYCDAVRVTANFGDGNTTSYVVPNKGFIHLPKSANEITVEQIAISDIDSAITGKFAEVDETGTPVANFNATFYAQDNADVQAYGVIMTTNATVAKDTDAFQANRSYVAAFQGTSTSLINEYTISVHSKFGGATKVYARSFVKVAGNVYYGEVVELSL